MTQPVQRTPRVERSDIDHGHSRPLAQDGSQVEPARPPVGQTSSAHGSSLTKKILLTLVGLVIVALVVRWAVGREKGSAAAPATDSAENRGVAAALAPATTRDVPIYLDGLGNATPLATVTVKSQVDGRLDKILFREGQHVDKGDVLAQVDPRPFMIQLHQAEAALTRDRAQLANARLNLDRYVKLRAQDLVAQQQVDDQRAMADQNDASVKADEAQIENAKLQLDYARIRSPVDGVTGVRLVDQGNIVHAADTTGIVVVTQLDPMSVLFTLPQDDLDRVAKSMSAGKVAVEAYSRDGATKLSVGELLVIDNQVNQATATVRLKATFPNPDNALWPNEFVKVRLLLETQRGVTVVPAAAVQRGPQGTFVYIVGADQTAAVRPIEVTSVDSQVAIIAKGISPGEQVVVEGQNQLRPGAKVQARPPQGGPPTGAPAGASSGGPGGRKRQRTGEGVPTSP